MSDRRYVFALLPALLAAALAPGCNQGGEKPQPEETAPPQEEAAAPSGTAVAELAPLADSGVKGRVVFRQTEAGVVVEADVTGLAPGKHGFHIHEWGDCSAPDGKSAGGHFNPTGAPHGGPEADEAHAGDLGNLVADANGHATLELTSTRISLSPGPTDIRGRAVIVHAGEDDLTSQPTGAAGGRLACGVIMEEGGDTQPVLPPSQP
ncbi:MAG: superoxide dismutase family protein [Acidobacteria bacterium]|nr:MAG: superoxide dismutase family protein [Acidobacteriota bacterium]